MCGIHGVLALSGDLRVNPEALREMGNVARLYLDGHGVDDVRDEPESVATA